MRPHSLLFGICIPLQRATLQHGQALGARNREAVKAEMMSRFPATAKPSVATVPACWAQVGVLRGQPGSAGSHISQHRLQLEVSAQHRTNVEQLMAVACGEGGWSWYIPIPRAAPIHPSAHGKSPHPLGLLLS